MFLLCQIKTNPDIDSKRVIRKKNYCNRKKYPILEICKHLITKRKKGLPFSYSQVKDKASQDQQSLWRNCTIMGMTSGSTDSQKKLRRGAPSTLSFVLAQAGVIKVQEPVGKTEA